MNDATLIPHIYECATDISLWPDVLRPMMKDIGAHKAVLCCNNEETLIWAQTVNLDRDYTDHVYRLREIDDFHAMRRFLPVGQTLLSHEIVPLDDFRQTEYYQSWAAPNQCVHIAGGLLNIGLNEWSALRFFRPETSPVFESEVKGYLDNYMPHMCKAVSISRRISNAEQHIHHYEKVFGLLACGLILLNCNRQIIFQNRAAEEILSLQDPITVNRGQMRPNDAYSQGQFAELFDRMTTSDTDAIPGGALLLRFTQHDKKPLQVWLARIGDKTTGFNWAGQSAEVACFLVDPDDKYTLPPNLLKQLYELTEREADLVHQLLKGRSLSNIAAHDGRSLNTLKTHLRSVFNKTETHRQNEIVALIQPLVDISQPL